MRAALQAGGYKFPFMLVRSQLAAVKQEVSRPVDMEELWAAYKAGPPPPMPPDPVANMLSCKMRGIRLTPPDKMERDFGTESRIIIEESQRWLDAHGEPKACDGPPPLRPGGHVQLQGQDTRPELNGADGTLVQWNEATGQWTVNMDGHLSTGAPCTIGCISATPECLVALPDSEPWISADDPHGQWGSLVDRFSWAERFPLQARAVGARFDSSGCPEWLPPPPEHLSLPPDHLSRVYSGAISDGGDYLLSEAERMARDPSIIKARRKIWGDSYGKDEIAALIRARLGE